MTYLHQTYNNKEVTKNIKIKQDVELEWISLLFVQLYKSIHYWRMDSKNITNVTKVVKELV